VLDELIRELDEPSDPARTRSRRLIDRALGSGPSAESRSTCSSAVDPDALVGELGADSLLAIAAEQEMQQASTGDARRASRGARSRVVGLQRPGTSGSSAPLLLSAQPAITSRPWPRSMRGSGRAPAGDLLAVAALMHLRGGFAFAAGTSRQP